MRNILFTLDQLLSQKPGSQHPYKMCIWLIIITAVVFLIILPLEGVLLVLTPVSPLTSEIRVSFPGVQLLVLLQKAGDRESFPACVTSPGFLARVSPFVDVQVGRQLVGLPANVAAEGALVGV